VFSHLTIVSLYSFLYHHVFFLLLPHSTPSPSGFCALPFLPPHVLYSQIFFLSCEGGRRENRGKEKVVGELKWREGKGCIAKK
jgi:hypothetical protein